jgi:hypothetical protein
MHGNSSNSRPRVTREFKRPSAIGLLISLLTLLLAIAQYDRSAVGCGLLYLPLSPRGRLLTLIHNCYLPGRSPQLPRPERCQLYGL